jgi:hypothetical protein
MSLNPITAKTFRDQIVSDLENKPRTGLFIPALIEDGAFNKVDVPSLMRYIVGDKRVRICNPDDVASCETEIAFERGPRFNEPLDE